MNVSSLLMVGKNVAAREAAASAARSAYSSAEITQFSSLAKAAEKPGPLGGSFLVLVLPSPELILEAFGMKNVRGLPLWPVVACSDDGAKGSERIIGEQDWKSERTRKILESAAALHELTCNNERLRGDLRTLGRRFGHDLRAPLNCVSTASESFSKLSPGATFSREALTQSLMGAVEEVATLIERVTFLLKATADPLPRRALDMKGVVWASLQRLDTKIRGKGATVAQPDSWPHVDGVDAWLEVIWGNLISNSLNHGGLSPKIELGWIRDSLEYTFRVRDHGPGVPADMRPQLFAPFDTLHHLNAPRGLGLSIVHRLVELMGGRCSYETPAGGGACFFFSLPVAQ